MTADLKVVEFKPKPADAEPKAREIDQTLVECLETMLAQAKEGKMVGIACSTLDDKNLVTYMKCGSHSFGTIGALQILSGKLVDFITRPQ